MAFQLPSWDQISSGLQAVGTASQYISQAANALKPSQTAQTVKTSATGNVQGVGGGDNSMMLAVLGIGALLLLKK